MNLDTSNEKERNDALFKCHKTALAQVGKGTPHQYPVALIDATTERSFKLISVDKVCELLDVQRTFVNERVASGDLPKPIKFGTSRRAAIRFVLSEIQDYIARLAAERHTPNSTNNSSVK
ncbi:hypothetical protein hmeg3_09600 [Herbaspirillum sp. meg3]|uniref:helix-turn-helix transcriptional regulator n=1 Tax=Herbaspirillum sp. meg3 TaxID=2025949 RepID=UPI000B990F80|nr:hypothetical protein [Herbaspirillum sp. meg3]ASU38525.1 hypothetical protein hmeg3_09600 [Herbaspirillum sp. meg3]